MGTDYVKAGACVDPSNEFNVVCALESTTCPSGHTYYSSRQIEQGSVLNTNANSCLDPANGEQVSVGRCSNQQVDDLICTSHKSGCGQPEEFNPVVQDCTIKDDTEGGRPTYYSKCWLDHRLEFCVWDMEECKGGPLSYTSSSPASYSKDCECGQVRTGACYHEWTDTYWCAVSSMGCDPDTVYVRWHELYSSNPDESLDCRLCKDDSPTSPVQPPTTVAAPSPPPAAYVVTPVPPPTPFPQPTFAPSPAPETSFGSGELAAAIAFPPLLLAAVLACCIGRHQKQKFSSSAIDMGENDNGEEDQEVDGIQGDEMLDDGEFQLDGDKEIT